MRTLSLKDFGTAKSKNANNKQTRADVELQQNSRLGKV